MKPQYDESSYKKFFITRKNELCGFLTELKNQHWWQIFPVQRGEIPFVIEIPEGIETIKENAFLGLKSTKNGAIMIVLGEGVKRVEKGAFTGCDIEKLYISDSVKFIDKDAFRLSKIKEIMVDKTSPLFKSENGALFDREMTTLIRYGIGSEQNEYTVPDGVKIIGKRAFENTQQLEYVNLPESVSEIQDGAFYNSGIKGIVLGDNVVAIGQNAFAMCKSLKSFKVPCGLVSINHRLFYGCCELEEVIIPEGVTSIGTEAFFGCSLLREISLPKELVAIESGAFEGCKSLKDFPLPSNISAIEARTFKGCNCFEDVIIPSNILKIGTEAFGACKRLRSINIGVNVSQMEDYVFLGCQSNLTVIISGKTRKKKLPFNKKWRYLSDSGLFKKKIKRIAYM